LADIYKNLHKPRKIHYTVKMVQNSKEINGKLIYKHHQHQIIQTEKSILFTTVPTHVNEIKLSKIPIPTHVKEFIQHQEAKLLGSNGSSVGNANTLLDNNDKNSKKYRELFLIIKKTLPVKWVDNEMIVLDQVKVKADFSCELIQGSIQVLERVERIIAIERPKLSSIDDGL
jgi:hypothetical protein